jgi:hypothetical protein
MADSFRDAAAGLYRCRIDRLIIGFFFYGLVVATSGVRSQFPWRFRFQQRRRTVRTRQQGSAKRQTNSDCELITAIKHLQINKAKKKSRFLLTYIVQIGKKRKSLNLQITNVIRSIYG